MNLFNKRAALRIAVVSVALAGIAAPIAWFIATENAEEQVVALAIDESRQHLQRFSAGTLSGETERNEAFAAARMIVGGIFDIAEVYDRTGAKLAEALSDDGEKVELRLPKHGKPAYTTASYESLKLTGDLWALRVFVPLRKTEIEGTAITGYFEGVHVVTDREINQIRSSASSVALMTCLAALLCGATIYPIVVRLSAENERKAREVLDSHISMMEALGRAIAKRDSDTGAHNYRVAWIAARIGEEVGLSGSTMQALIAGSFLHDVGKIGIPDAILLKPGRLDDVEMETMRTHVALGEEIVCGMGWLDGAHEVVAAHHEKWDGFGYPRQLAEEAIPLSARIFAVADVFDALSSKRPYKDPMPFEEVMDILKKDAGKHFDPRIVSIFETIAGEIREHLQDRTEATARTLLEARIRMHFEM
jgi:HD-GYP domain-containing protein (c-di-GMP phosphodiesterase class II)